MQTTFICKNCEKEKPANYRLKGDQKYCGDIECQLARKAAWQRAKTVTDAKYRTDKKAGNKDWRNNRPAHLYQSQYRESHPDYVLDNRNKQRIRNRRRREKLATEKIVKMDACTSIEPHIYIMTPYEKDASGKIVKMDAYLVQLEPFQQDKHNCFAALP